MPVPIPLLGPVPGIAGSGLIAEITLGAKGKGEGLITLENVTLLNASGVPLTTNIAQSNTRIQVFAAVPVSVPTLPLFGLGLLGLALALLGRHNLKKRSIRRLA